MENLKDFDEKGVSEMDAKHSKEIVNPDGTGRYTPPTSGTGPISSERITACQGKSYGDACTWTANSGVTQKGKCIYDKWGLTKGKLFCAGADYRAE